MEAGDTAAVLSIQSACPEIAQWTLRDYTRVADGEMAGWVAAAEHDAAAGLVLSGFIVARRVASDLEILNFAVAPERRRRGVGNALFKEAVGWGTTFGAEKTFLEVRVSNLAAIRFYERHGFQVTGRRPRYYTSPIEDALVLAAPFAAA
jgi:[ribosomal protein S18]-alanine N-acetyltransferase